MSRHREWNLSCKVYVGNLGNNGTKYELESVFSKYGPLRNVWVARNPPGFAFIEFEDPRDAEDAVRGLDGSRMCGTRARVEMSSGRTRRNNANGSGGSGGSRRGGRERSRSPRRSSYSRSRSRSRDNRRSPADYRTSPREYRSSPREYRSSPREYRTSPRNNTYSRYSPRDNKYSPRVYRSLSRD